MRRTAPVRAAKPSGSSTSSSDLGGSHPVRHQLADHYRSEVGVRPRYGREDRGVDDPESVHTEYAAVRCDDGGGVVRTWSCPGLMDADGLADYAAAWARPTEESIV